MPRLLQARKHHDPQRIPLQRHPVRRIHAHAGRAAARRIETRLHALRQIRRIARRQPTAAVHQRRGDRPRIRLPKQGDRLRAQEGQGLRRPLHRRRPVHTAHAHAQIRHQKQRRARRLLELQHAGRSHHRRNRRQARHHRRHHRQRHRHRHHRQHRHRQGTRQRRQLQRRPQPSRAVQNQHRRQQHRAQPQRRRLRHHHKLLRQRHAVAHRQHRQNPRHRRPTAHRQRDQPADPPPRHRTLQWRLRIHRRPHRQSRQGQRRSRPRRTLPRVRHHQGLEDRDGQLH